MVIASRAFENGDPAMSPLSRDVIDGLYQRATTRWPAISLERQAYADFLQRAQAPIGDLSAEDVFLAAACAQGNPEAQEALELTFFNDVRKAVLAVSTDPGFVDEVLQRLRQRLYVASDNKPRGISKYAARGSLGAWLRLTAVRLAIDLARRTKPAADVEALDWEAVGLADLELVAIKSQYRQAFKAAFHAAIAALQPRHRSALRLSVLDRLSIDEIGAMYQVHRSTAARWLADAKQALLDQTRHNLVEVQRLTASEAEVVFGLVQSQLELSLQRVLASSANPRE
jgi:RNA polymerase sigma-70 factor (ECF subfamily)